MHKKFRYIYKTQMNKMSNAKLYKGSLTTIILKLLAEQDQMYGYQITQKVKELTKGSLQITEGALYPALHKLEADGLLTAEVTRVDNRIRKYYKLTPQGNAEKEAKLQALEDFIKNMEQLLNPKWRLQ